MSNGIYNSPFTKNYDSIMKSPQEILSPSSSGFGSPKPGTSRVIDSLHQSIDQLKAELAEIKQKSEDDKTRYESLRKRYDQVVDQLANAKHENDMANALFSRKDRRIHELEEKLMDSVTSTEDYKFNLEKLEVRCKRLQESEKVATGEFERMKIAYETVVTAQKEFREYYTQQVSELRSTLSEYMKQREEKLQETQSMLVSNTGEIQNQMKNMESHSHSLEKQYAANNAAVVDTLKSLALAAKSHGSDTQLVINQCNLVFVELKNRFNLDVDTLIANYKDAEVDHTIEKLLSPQISSQSSQSAPRKSQSSRKENIDPKIKTNTSHIKGTGIQMGSPLMVSPLASPNSNLVSPKVGGPLPKRHSRRISGADFSDFEKKPAQNQGQKSKRNSISSPQVQSQDWRNSRSASVTKSTPSTPNLDASLNEGDEESEVESDGEKKKKKKRRRRKKKGGKTDVDQGLEEVNSIIKNDLTLEV